MVKLCRITDFRDFGVDFFFRKTEFYMITFKVVVKYAGIIKILKISGINKKGLQRIINNIQNDSTEILNLFPKTSFFFVTQTKLIQI